jgi:soluble lytic murein transglycosylase-like protein
MASDLLTAERKGDDVFLLFAGAAAYAFAVKDFGATPYDREFDAAGAKYGVPSNLLRAIARKESNFRNVDSRPNANGTVDHGVMQVNDRTAAHYGVSVSALSNPATCIDVAAHLLSDIRRELIARGRFSPFTWPAAYNVGGDLQPAAIGEAYASAVLFNWIRYDLGRVLAV